jgi:hypothetical protein
VSRKSLFEGKEPQDGKVRRFFWRVRHRVGPGWDKMSDREVRKALRQMSWRRPL